MAKRWALHLKRTKGCNLKHSSTRFRRKIPPFKYVGENLYQAWSSQPLRDPDRHATVAVDKWYGEIADYQYSEQGVVCPKRGHKKEIGHFTQVMWESTTDLGCSYTTCRGGRSLVIVCIYGPGGNFNQHVTPPFSPTVAQKLAEHPGNEKFGGLPRCDLPDSPGLRP